MQQNPIVSRDEWLTARIALLAKEKELTKLRDHLSTERRALPWVRVEKQYVFDGPSGKVTLADLFEGRSQLFIKHFMLGPGQRFWDKLSEGGEQGPCGWLKDKYGVSWQINPTVLGEMLNDPDPKKSKRVMEAMLTMKKIEIAGLKKAYES